MQTMSNDVANMNWLLTNLVDKVPGVVDAVVVSADGLLMAMSSGIGRAGGDQLAAIASGLTSLTQGAARCFGGGNVHQVLVELEAGYMMFMSISNGSSLAVLASQSADIGLVGYEMTMLCKRMGASLTPQLVVEMQAALPRS